MTRLHKLYPDRIIEMNELLEYNHHVQTIAKRTGILRGIIVEYKIYYNRMKHQFDNKTLFLDGKQEPYFKNEMDYGSDGKMDYKILTND